MKPTTKRNMAYMFDAWDQIEFGSVDLLTWQATQESFFSPSDPPYPGFYDTRYEYNSTDNKFYRISYSYEMDDEGDEAWVEIGRVGLSIRTNTYEAFAFGASSIVSAVGGVNSMAGLGSVFDAGRSINLSSLVRADGTTAWSPKSTGHSAQFVFSNLDVAGYWKKLVGDVQ